MFLTPSQLKTFAIVWLAFISILFFLPGSVLPKAHWFEVVHFDKWVHFGFFAVLLFCWRFYFPGNAKFTRLLFLFAVVYGFGVEVIQHYFIPNRSFDLGDVAADSIGAIAGLWFWTKRSIKNRPL